VVELSLPGVQSRAGSGVSRERARIDGAERSRKSRGAYYTHHVVADFLLRWAIGSGRETVLDPSFGGGVFLLAAARRLAQLGGSPSEQIFGVEIDEDAFGAFICQQSVSLSREHFLRTDFFEVEPCRIPSVDAVVGNPPFIRYQKFNGAAREAALRCASRSGVALSRLTSSWAPFLVHATQFIRPSGRLAMVAPAELTYASYARPVLDYLCRTFQSIQILTFSKRLFRLLSEDTVLVLADGRGEPFEEFSLIELPDAPALATLSDPRHHLPTGTRVDATAIGKGHERLLRYALSESARDLYAALRSAPGVATLAEVADIGIGYVTGENDFFHVDQSTVDRFHLPSELLRPAVRSGSNLRGLHFTREDWIDLREAGEACYLLAIPDVEESQLPSSVRDYLAEGIQRAVPTRYKCRTRRHWFAVPYIHEADGFLTYMSGLGPKLVANDCGAVAPNTLHVLRIYPLLERHPVTALQLAVAWQTSLTALSCELEGHSLGGGMLKLEPSEAGRVRLALPPLDGDTLTRLSTDLGHLLRKGQSDEARARADQALLREALGLPEDQIADLQRAWRELRARRLTR
jgi:adenine-specific DNA-methyltransferase